MSKIVVDSSVILAVIKGEDGADSSEILTTSVASAINVTEVLSKLVLFGVSEGSGLISELGVEVVDFTEEFIDLTASLIQYTKPYGLSLGDRACLALGIMKKPTSFNSRSHLGKAGYRG